MKYMIASDIHGSLSGAEKLAEIFKKEKADMLVLLGDLYYHGPRNPLPDGYAPIKVAELLNKIKDKLIVIHGNCDSEVDEMVSDFKFYPEYKTTVGGRTVYFTHGHKYNKFNLPELPVGSLLIYGHFHINEIEEKSGIICVNVGSVSLPKENSVPPYAILTDKDILIKNLNGEICYRYLI